MKKIICLITLIFVFCLFTACGTSGEKVVTSDVSSGEKPTASTVSNVSDNSSSELIDADEGVNEEPDIADANDYIVETEE